MTNTFSYCAELLLLLPGIPAREEVVILLKVNLGVLAMPAELGAMGAGCPAFPPGVCTLCPPPKFAAARVRGTFEAWAEYLQPVTEGNPLKFTPHTLDVFVKT